MKKEKLGPLIREGSAKDLHQLTRSANPGEDIAFRFTDWFSVFDVGRADYPIPGKGQAVCACAVKSFRIAEKIGVPTNFVEQLDDITIRVKRAQVITHRKLTLQDENYVVPAEFIYRLRVAGSIHRDFNSGKKKPENYGLPPGASPPIGTPFPYPIHHFTTKFEDVDRDITNEDVCALAGITTRDQEHYWSMIDRLTGAMALELANTGYVLVDGKMECLMGPGRTVMIGDVFGTQDEDRFCPRFPLDQGRAEHYSKECIRQLLIEMGYYEKLVAARNAGAEDLPIPRLPEEQIAEVSRRYKIIAHAYAGLKLG